MKRFHNILAAVDLASGGQLVCAELSAPNREVVQQAVMWYVWEPDLARDWEPCSSGTRPNDCCRN